MVCFIQVPPTLTQAMGLAPGVEVKPLPFRKAIVGVTPVTLVITPPAAIPWPARPQGGRIVERGSCMAGRAVVERLTADRIDVPDIRRVRRRGGRRHIAALRDRVVILAEVARIDGEAVGAGPAPRAAAGAEPSPPARHGLLRSRPRLRSSPSHRAGGAGRVCSTSRGRMSSQCPANIRRSCANCRCR